MTFKRKITTKLTVLSFGLMVLFFSCEKELPYQPGSLGIDELAGIYYAEENITFQAQYDGLTRIVWKFSDGSVYEGRQIQRIFQTSGTYEVKLTGYYNNQVVDTSSYTIDVKYKSRTIKLDKAFYAIRSKIVNSKIILEGLFEGETSTRFLEFDLNLNYLGILNNLDKYGNNVFNNIQLGEEVFSLNNNFYVVKDNLMKSATEFSLPEVYFSQEIIQYASGLIHYYDDSESSFHIDYYNSELTKLWTKTFKGENRAKEKYVFNNQDKLYYLSFEKSGDKLFLEKFKNVSLNYEHKAFELGIDAADRKILFAVFKPYSKTIDLAIFSYKTGLTYFFSIDENCELNRKGEISESIDGRVLYTLTDGSAIIKDQDKILKFNNNFSSIKVRNFDAFYFDMFEMGDNQYLVCETFNNSMRLSFINKHLEQIIFE